MDRSDPSNLPLAGGIDISILPVQPSLNVFILVTSRDSSLPPNFECRLARSNFLTQTLSHVVVSRLPGNLVEITSAEQERNISVTP